MRAVVVAADVDRTRRPDRDRVRVRPEQRPEFPNGVAWREAGPAGVAERLHELSVAPDASDELVTPIGPREQEPAVRRRDHRVDRAASISVVDSRRDDLRRADDVAVLPDPTQHDSEPGPVPVIRAEDD